MRSIAVVLALVPTLALAACGTGTVQTTHLPVATTDQSLLNAQQLRDSALEWIETHNTEAVGTGDKWVYSNHGTATRWTALDPKNPWPPGDLWIDGESYVFPAGAVNDVVTEWIHATPQEMSRLYEEAGADKGWFKIRLALFFVLHARLDGPLSLLQHMEPIEGVATQTDGSLVVRGTAHVSDLVGNDLPKDAVSRWMRPDVYGDQVDITLTVAREANEPLKMVIGLAAGKTTRVYSFGPATAESVPPSVVTELANSQMVKDVQ